MFREDFFLDDRSDCRLAARKFPDALCALDLLPVNGRVSGQNPEALHRRELLIDGANKWEQLPEKPRHSAHWLAGIPPHFSRFRERNILSRNIAIQDRLIERIAAFNFNVV